MNRAVLSLLIVLACTGCASKSKSVSSSVATESSTVVVSRSVSAPDTIMMPLAPQSESIVTRDSVSVLVNDYARSCVTLNPDGSLSHSLSSRHKAVPVAVNVTTTRIDTVATGTTIQVHDTRESSPSYTALWIGVGLLLIVALAARLFA